jgi:hypothetical protein
MTERFLVHYGEMYIVDHIVRLDASYPFTPFVYRGLCEVSMHRQGSRTTIIQVVDAPQVLSHEQAIQLYPEFFI